MEIFINPKEAFSLILEVELADPDNLFDDDLNRKMVKMLNSIIKDPGKTKYSTNHNIPIFKINSVSV